MFSTFLLSLALIVISLVSGPKMKVADRLISPPILVNTFVLLYPVIGFELYWQGSYTLLGQDFSQSLTYIFNAINIFTITFTFSYFLFYKYTKTIRQSDFYIIEPKKLAIISLIFSSYVLATFAGVRAPIIHNLLLLTFNALIFLIAYSLLTKSHLSLPLSILLVSLITFIGFRYRLVLFFIPIILYKIKFDANQYQTKIKYLLISFAAFVFIAVVGVTRTYSSGLDLSYTKGLSFTEILINGLFNDTSTVIASGALMQMIDQNNAYAYFNQLIYIFSYFIPSELNPAKLYSPVFTYVSVLNGQERNESGQAIMGFAEYYHTAGYLGVAFFALSFSYIFAKLYKRARVTGCTYRYYLYFALITLLLNTFTRGYFPQNAQDLASVLIGVFLIKKLSKKTLVSMSKTAPVTQLSH